MAFHSNKRIKLDDNQEDDNESWGDDDDYGLTSEKFDEIQSQFLTEQCQRVEILDVATPPGKIQMLEAENMKLKEEQDIHVGQIKILKAKVEEKSTELIKEREEKEKAIQARLTLAVDKQHELKKNNEKLATELKFKEQELRDMKEKLEKFKKENKHCTNNSPKRIKTSNTKASLPSNFPDVKTFYNNVKCDSKTVQTDEQSTSSVHSRAIRLSFPLQLPFYTMFISDTDSLNVSKSTVSSEPSLISQKNILRKPEPIKTLVNFPFVTNITKNDKIVRNFCHQRAVIPEPKLSSEFELLKNITLVLKKYLNFVAHTCGKQYGSTNIITPDSDKFSPEPLEIKCKYRLESKHAILLQQHFFSVVSVLKLLYHQLKANQIMRTLLIRDMFNYQPFPLFSSGSSSNSSIETTMDDSKCSIASVLIGSVVPIEKDGRFQNHNIVKLTLDILKVLFTSCDECCINKYSVILKDLPLNIFVTGTYGPDIRLATLQLLLLSSKSLTVKDLFAKHQDFPICILHCMSKNLPRIKRNALLNDPNLTAQLNELVLIEVKLLKNVIGHFGIDVIFNADCACFRGFMVKFFTWLHENLLINQIRSGSTPDQIMDNDLLKYVIFLDIVLNLPVEQLELLGKKFQKFILIIRHLAHMKKGPKKTPLDALIKKLKFKMLN